MTYTAGNNATTVNGAAASTGCRMRNAGGRYTLIASASNVVPGRTRPELPQQEVQFVLQR